MSGSPRPPIAFLSGGFRPFFLLGALQAAAAIGVFVPWYLGLLAPASLFAAPLWHAHELLFGFVPAVIAGFLTTAIPNWTKRPPLVGAPLAVLVGLWLAGRLAILVSARIGWLPTALVDGAFLVGLAAWAGREIVAGGDRRNLKTVAWVILLAVANGLFHWEVERWGRTIWSERLGLVAVLALILVVGGRVVPQFTANRLAGRGDARTLRRSAPLDVFAAWAAGVALVAWVVAGRHPEAAMPAGILLAVAGTANLVRLAGWRGLAFLGEPLLAVLHLGWLTTALGFLLAAAAEIRPDVVPSTAAIHLWTSGAIGLFTLAIMTRASRGHTGRPLVAGAPTTALYAFALIAATARVAVALRPEWTLVGLAIAGLAWIVAFLGFAVLHTPMLIRPRR